MDLETLFSTLHEIMDKDTEFVLSPVQGDSCQLQRHYRYFYFWTRLESIATIKATPRIGGLRLTATVSNEWHRKHSQNTHLILKKYLKFLMDDAIDTCKRHGHPSDSDSVVVFES